MNRNRYSNYEFIIPKIERTSLWILLHSLQSNMSNTFYTFSLIHLFLLTDVKFNLKKVMGWQRGILSLSNSVCVTSWAGDSKTKATQALFYPGIFHLYWKWSFVRYCKLYLYLQSHSWLIHALPTIPVTQQSEVRIDFTTIDFVQW